MPDTLSQAVGHSSGRMASPIIEPACKAFSGEMVRMSACLLWLMSDTSGSRTTLPSPCPLRTVRESFPSHGSSLSLARFRTRLPYGHRVGMHLLVASRMEEHTVGFIVRPAQRSPHDVVVVPPRQLGDLLVTDRADPLLCFPQTQQLPPSLQGACHLDA